MARFDQLLYTTVFRSGLRSESLRTFAYPFWQQGTRSFLNAPAVGQARQEKGFEKAFDHLRAGAYLDHCLRHAISALIDLR
jgi:hypothetical protein